MEKTGSQMAQVFSIRQYYFNMTQLFMLENSREGWEPSLGTNNIIALFNWGNDAISGGPFPKYRMYPKMYSIHTL